MEIIVHKPIDEDVRMKIESIVATAHADAVRRYITRLECSKDKKIEKLKEIIEDIK